MAPSGTPSLTMTVAHELGHNLGLPHPANNDTNLMEASTSDHNLTPDQIAIAKGYALGNS